MQYFDIPAQAEGIRMHHALAGKPLNDVTIPREEWTTVQGSK